MTVTFLQVGDRSTAIDDWWTWSVRRDPSVYQTPSWIRAWSLARGGASRVGLLGNIGPRGTGCFLPVDLTDGRAQIVGGGLNDRNELLWRGGPRTAEERTELARPLLAELAVLMEGGIPELDGQDAAVFRDSSHWRVAAGQTSPRLNLLNTAQVRRRASASQFLKASGANVTVLRDPRVVRSFTAEFLQLKKRAWEVRGRSHELSSNERWLGFSDFLSDAVSNLAARGLSRYVVAQVSGEVAAASLVFGHTGSWQLYMTCFDPRFASLSPGIASIRSAILMAAQAGVPVFDFGRGDEPYKYSFGAVDHFRYDAHQAPHA